MEELTNPAVSMTVSVIIPAFNSEASIEAAIGSVLGQRYSGKVEVVIVDDGSFDSTSDILRRYSGAAKVIRQENRGPAAARNTGVARSSGELIAFLDADDAWLPEKLSRTVAILDREPQVALVYSDAIALGRQGEVISNSVVPADKARAPSISDLLSDWWPIFPSTVVMRRGVFEQCGGFCERFTAAAYEDTFFFIAARQCGEFRYLHEPLVRYHAEPVVGRMEKYLPHQRLFIELLREKYGAAATPLIKKTLSGYASALGYEGLIAMRNGELRQARQSFLRALRHDPTSVRTYLRLARTFLPAPIARRLGGRTAD